MAAVKDPLRKAKLYAPEEHAMVRLDKRTYGTGAGGAAKAQRSERRDPSVATKLLPQQDDEEAMDCCDVGCTLREVAPQAVQAWLLFQVLALLFQASLWWEVSGHLSHFEDTLATQCTSAQTQHGVCLGPMWNLSTWQETTLEGDGEEFQRPSRRRRQHLEAEERGMEHWNWPGFPNPSASHSFDFATRSSPPTFLVAVQPLARAHHMGEEPANATSDEALAELEESVHWYLRVTRVDPPLTTRDFVGYYYGSNAFTIRDLSEEALTTLGTRGEIRWRGTLTNRGWSRLRTRFAAFVEDALPTAVSLAGTHGHLSAEVEPEEPGCSFAHAWKAFNARHQGRSHKALSWCRTVLFLCVPLSALVVGLVAWSLKHEKGNRPGGVGLYFHSAVFAKCLLVDVPQQVCIVLYLLGWYEAEGLRCQLCLFHPQHCEPEHPFRFSNSVAFSCTLFSSVANQLIVRPVWKKFYTEEEECMQTTARIAHACLATLPFSTGVFWATSSLLSTPVLVQVLAFGPCVIGWLTVVGLFFCWLVACCGACEDL